MTRALALLLPPLLAFAAAGPEAPKAKDSTSASETILPIFTPAGNRLMYIRGSAAEISNTTQRAQMKDMHLTMYAGDAASTVESIVVAPEATLLLGQDYVFGEKSVRIVRSDLDAAATKWSYDKRQQVITLTGNVKVTFNTELKDILR